jgi:hypothetical protein
MLELLLDDSEHSAVNNKSSVFEIQNNARRGKYLRHRGVHICHVMQGGK